MKKNAQAAPTLLTAADAMAHAADFLDRMSVNLELAHILAESFRKNPAPVEDENARTALNDLNTYASGIVDLSLQKEALTSAAREIRALANETKLVEARAKRDGISRVPA